NDEQQGPNPIIGLAAPKAASPFVGIGREAGSSLALSNSSDFWDSRCGFRLGAIGMRVESPAFPIGLQRSGHPPLGADVVALILVGFAYFALAYLGLRLASIHPSATPVWPPTGLAIAAILLWGNRIAPAIFIGAFLINELTAGSIFTSLAIAGGNT